MKYCRNILLLILCFITVTGLAETVETNPAELVIWSEAGEGESWFYLEREIDLAIEMNCPGSAIAYVDALRGDVITFDFYLNSEKQEDFLIITIDDIHALTISGTTPVWLNCSLAFPRDGHHTVVFQFSPKQENSDKYVQINNVYKLTGYNAQQALEVDNREFLNRIELGACQISTGLRFFVPELNYVILCRDQYNKPVAGAMINACDDISCQLLTTDENGRIDITMSTYPYEFHVLRVPSGYSCDPQQTFIINELESFIILKVHKN